MKRRTKILITLVVIFMAVFAIVYTYLSLMGKTIAIRQLENLTKRKVNITYFNITPPLNINIKNLEIEGLVKADSVTISPSIIGLLTGNIAFNNLKILKPEFTYERKPAELTASSPTATLAATRKPLSYLIIKNLNIKDGRINFIDHTVGPVGIRIVVKDLDFKLTNAYALARSIITNFELKAKIPWQEGREEGKIEAEGWLNLFKKDMQATLKIEDIDGVYLYPYYSNWVDLEKARIQSAKLNFSSNIQGLNNNLTAECHLELTDIVRKPRAADEEVARAEKIADAVMDVFRALNQGKIVLDFTIRTKMDRPEFGFGNIKMAFEDKLAKGRRPAGFNIQETLNLPTKLIQGTFKGLTDMTNAVIGGTISAAKQIGKAVEDTFKKEKKE